MKRLACTALSALLPVAALVAVSTATPASSAPALPDECSAEGNQVTCVFTEDATFTVPAWVTAVEVVAVGGNGGSGRGEGVRVLGGRGGHVEHTIPTRPGSLPAPRTLVLHVGGNGGEGQADGYGSSGGAHGGGAGGEWAGGGGGATTVFSSPALTERLVVAPGGGGGGGKCYVEYTPCGTGGDAGTNGSTAYDLGTWPTGGRPDGTPGTGGQGDIGAGTDGWPGTADGQGGNGANNHQGGGGGGGGGGYHGGGGGGSAATFHGAGGGGGTPYPPSAPMTLGDGNPRVELRYVDRTIGDETAPTVSVDAGPSPRMAATAKVSWSGSDNQAGVAGYDVQMTKAAWHGAVSAPKMLRTATTARSLPMNLARGSQYCFRVRAHDHAGNTSDWSTERCTTRPLDDRALTGTGWKRVSGGGYLDRTATTTSRKGRVLALQRVPAGRVALVVSKGRNHGRLEVRYGTRVVKRLSLAGPARNRVVVRLPDLKKRTTIRLRTTTDKPVQVDGIVVTRR
ncbi:glycine-rich protein [Nocardioides sp. J54]|uniref:glycine-rich protein n=1 Tax=Nocardioides sp. J54 TaxID=935866 RepID=UPI0004B2CD78|nr:glycine-rich protein [Nocardioides sp. J54]